MALLSLFTGPSFVEMVSTGEASSKAAKAVVIERENWRFSSGKCRERWFRYERARAVKVVQTDLVFSVVISASIIRNMVLRVHGAVPAYFHDGIVIDHWMVVIGVSVAAGFELL